MVEAGARFGRWIVLSNPVTIGRWLYQNCRCDCGTVRLIRESNLIHRQSRSCGCLKRERLESWSRNFKHGESRGGIKRNQGTVEYATWVSVIQRCTNPKAHDYGRYGGRGIRVCQRWRQSFENFLSDMGRRPDGLTLERIDNDGDYEPQNCRWATWDDQYANRRRKGR